MNKLYILIFTLLISCKSPSQEGKFTTNNIAELKQSFSNKNGKEFLEKFPNDFSSFNEIFGWDDKKDSAEPLYKEANSYIDYWFSLIEEPQFSNYEKSIISISKNGKWDADAANYFKEKSLNYISKNRKYNLINILSKEDAKSFLTFLFDSPHPKPDNNFISNLNQEKQEIAKEIYANNISSESKRSTLTTYENNTNYFIKTFDVNKDGVSDKIVSNKPYQGEDLFVFFGNKKGEYKLSLETRNFSEDGGNIIQDILPLTNVKGLQIITSFPDRGYYEKEYNIIMKNNSWFLQNIVYKTMSDNSENAVKYICDVPQNIDITKSGWTEKINPIPEENERNKKCRVEKVILSKSYTIQDPDGYTNLRKDKNTSSEIVQKIKSGEHIEVLNNSGDWFLIKTQEGKQGYVHKSRIKSN